MTGLIREKAMKVSEFIEWLKTQDQGATVDCILHDSTGSYYEQGGTIETAHFDPDKEHWEYVDWRKNRFVKSDAPYYQTRTLLIGYSS